MEKKIKKNFVTITLVMIFGFLFLQITNIDSSVNTVFATGGSGGGGSSGGGSGSFGNNGSSDKKNTSNADDNTGYLPQTTVGGEFDYTNNVPKEKFTKGENINASLKKVCASALLILQIASVGGIVFAGVRYMFASSETKADIKSSMIHLVIGMVIVFTASTIVNLIVKVFTQIKNT